jgi:hypothetical protein
MRHTVLSSSLVRRTTLLLLGAMLAVLVVAIAATAHAQPVPCGYGDCVDVSSTAGWETTGVTVQKGHGFQIDSTAYPKKKWTVDYRNFPYVGPRGYPKSIDSQIYQGCKIDPKWPYGRLIGRVGEGSTYSRIFSVGGGGVFTAHASGQLYLRIHDADGCLGDNAGTLRVRAWPL